LGLDWSVCGATVLEVLCQRLDRMNVYSIGAGLIARRTNCLELFSIVDGAVVVYFL